MKEILIGGKKIGPGHPPLIIAEMSGNHNQSLDRALAIVDAAAKSGAHALKLQTYTADTMTVEFSERAFFISDAKSLWKGSSLFKLYQQAYTPWEWHKPISDRCRELGMLFFSTPFDFTAVDFLETLDVAVYKIASFENVDLPLIRKAASTGKPLIISTGMASVAELSEAVDAARGVGCKDIILLKCTSAYPSTPEDSNLKTIPHLRELFGVEVGLSDHTMGIGVSVASVALGATVIEKHFTLDRGDGGVDSSFSIEPAELKALVAESERAWFSLGRISYGPTEREKASLQYRRSIYIVKDMAAGGTFSSDTIRIIRPGFGLAPKFWEVVLGKRAKTDVKAGMPLSWEIIS